MENPTTQLTLFDLECPSSAKYQETSTSMAELGHPPTPAVEWCPSMRTAVLEAGYVVKGVRVRCKAKGCRVCGPIEWELHTAPIRATAEAGVALYFLEVGAPQRQAFHKRVKRAGAEAKFVPTHRDVFLCVTTLPEGRKIDIADLESLLLEAFEMSSTVRGNVTGTRGWKKAPLSGEESAKGRHPGEWTLVGYAGMSPEKAERAAVELGEELPQLHVRTTKSGFTTHCTDPDARRPLSLRLRILVPEVLADHRHSRQHSSQVIAMLRRRKGSDLGATDFAGRAEVA